MKNNNPSEKSPIENLPKEQKDIFKQATLNIERRKGKEYAPTAKELQEEINSVVSKMETTPNEMADCTKCKNHFSNPFDQDFCEKNYDLEADEDCEGIYFKDIKK